MKLRDFSQIYEKRGKQMIQKIGLFDGAYVIETG
jgi:hypothetical protein